MISIISLLASVVLTSLNNARGKARDAKRLIDKNQMILALNLYYNDNNSWPPPIGSEGVCVGPAGETCWVDKIGSAAFVSAMSPYLASFPNNNAPTGTAAYNRMVFVSNAAANWLGAGSPAGAYLLWVQENGIGNCPSPYWNNQDAYYYCYEFIGSS